MGGGPAAAGGSLTVEQRDEVFLFRWLFGLSFKQIDEQVPDWERTVLLDRAVEWLPRILQLEHAPGADQPATGEGLPLAELGIQTTMVAAPV